jgi:hypothetical protein
MEKYEFKTTPVDSANNSPKSRKMSEEPYSIRESMEKLRL